MTRRRTAILVSGRGSNMGALIAAARDPAYPAEIALVVSNEAEAGALARAREAGVATAIVAHRAHGTRAAFEAVLRVELQRHQIELVCLAGFMRVLSAAFVEAWRGALINIHPSLLPAFPGLRTHERALAEGVRIHGCSVHFVVAALDAGPLIAQAAVPVDPADTPETLGARVLAAEHRLFPLALGWVAAGRVQMEDGRTRFMGPPRPEVDDKRVLISPYNL